jgi:hypothetical protein
MKNTLKKNITNLEKMVKQGIILATNSHYDDARVLRERSMKARKHAYNYHVNIESSAEQIQSINNFGRALYKDLELITFEEKQYQNHFFESAELKEFYENMTPNTKKFYSSVKKLLNILDKPAFYNSNEGTFIINRLKDIHKLKDTEAKIKKSIENDVIESQPVFYSKLNITATWIPRTYDNSHYEFWVKSEKLEGKNTFLNRDLTEKEIETLSRNIEKGLEHLLKLKNHPDIGHSISQFNKDIYSNRGKVTVNYGFYDKHCFAEMDLTEPLFARADEKEAYKNSEFIKGKHIIERCLEENLPIDSLLITPADLQRKYASQLSKFSKARKDYNTIIDYLWDWNEKLKPYKILEQIGFPITFADVNDKNIFETENFYPLNLLPNMRYISDRAEKLKIKKFMPQNKISDSDELRLITGQNNGGKTTYINAKLEAYLNFQAGLPILARSAKFPVYDGIFSHTVKSNSDRDKSTLASSILDYKTILRQASRCKNPWLILDELGSGTDFSDIKIISERVIKATHQLRCSADVITQFREVIDMAVDKYSAKPYMMNNYKVISGIGMAGGVIIANKLGLTEDFINNLKPNEK